MYSTDNTTFLLVEDTLFIPIRSMVPPTPRRITGLSPLLVISSRMCEAVAVVLRIRLHNHFVFTAPSLPSDVSTQNRGKQAIFHVFNLSICFFCFPRFNKCTAVVDNCLLA